MRYHFNAGVVVVLLFCLSLLLTGCQFWAQPGKTAQEGTLEQVRTIKINHREMMQDLNHALLLDRPSKLNQMSIP